MGLGDPERTLRGAGLPYYSIQVGLSRHVIREYVDEWVAGIEDYTPRVRKIYDLLQSGQADKAHATGDGAGRQAILPLVTHCK